ncbi:DUF305 domain-containing protein [Streptomyces johnsoniae]|uniref:DUF305 domain-containing protein n=1 Tax=Streptomyces johnsoniae TaxID=3075532 RepID=A0ABU2SFW5_9ACTN|nr:DUF305 domain-containing protein [Streptomyces sp. DSM 41886]MDT0447274.1 DUF305 domain-containing protein [Streptomyces sp. DSM 41886]
MTATPAARAAAALLAGLLLAGCGGSDGGTDEEDAGTGPAAATDTGGTAGATEAAGEPAAAGDLSPTDLAWAQLMIPMNDQLLPLLDEVTRRGSAPGLREFAEELAAGHETELTGLHALLRDAGVTYTNVHEGHSMPGMVTDEELAALEDTRDEDFDREAMALIAEHLEQSARVSRSERDAGSAEAATALAADLDEARTGQLAELERLGG